MSYYSKRISCALIFSLLAIVFSCSCTAGNRAASKVASSNSGNEEIQFPEIPAEITEPSERADYVLLNFWAPADFRNEEYVANDEALEKDFVNFVQFYSFASPEAAAEATQNLLKKASVNSEAYSKIADLARKYLYERESDYFDEGAFLYYLSAILNDNVMSKDEKIRYRFLYDAALKNRPGSIASDFRFIDRNGNERRLLKSLSAPYNLVIYYNPDCEECHSVIERLKSENQLNSMLTKGYASVLAIDSEGDREEWERTKKDMPSNWTVGYDLDDIQDNETYIFDHTPVLYLLAKDGTVIFKDATVAELMEFAQNR